MPSAIIIGSGAAGSACARALARHAWKVVVVERGRVGGTCLWRGCVPKKALLTSAAAFDDARRRLPQLGIDCAATLDWDGALAWKWHAQETYAGDQAASLASHGVEVVAADARFSGPSALHWSGADHTADAIVIATGATPVVPQVSGAQLFDTSDDALHFPRVPASLLIAGGGFIAAELAAVYAMAGAQVGLVIRGKRLLDAIDEEIADVAVRRLSSLGVSFAYRTDIESLDGKVGDVHVKVRDTGGRPHDLHAERVIAATGRVPALADLDLDAAGVDSRDGRLTLAPSLNSISNPRVWAVGDAAGLSMHTPVANYLGRVVAESIATGQPRVPDLEAAPFAVFTTPQLAQAGLTESAARARGIDVAVGRRSFVDLGAGVIADERDGLAKLVFDAASGRLLGGAVAGPTASDLIYAIEIALRAGMTAEELRESLAIHPAFSEALAHAAWF